MLWMDLGLFVHSPVEGQLAVVNKAAVNIQVQAFV